MKPDFSYENALFEKGFKMVAGVDEVGRGPVAGPIVSAAVIMNPEAKIIEGITDSKALTSAKRAKLKEEIMKNCLAWNISEISGFVIDKEGISKANRLALKSAVLGLKIRPDYTLIDFFTLQPDILSTGIVKGDLKVYSIACASILAKVYRDDIMVSYASKYPEYKFDQNKGYLTKFHLEAISEHGFCEVHRQSFWPVREMIF